MPSATPSRLSHCAVTALPTSETFASLGGRLEVLTATIGELREATPDFSETFGDLGGLLESVRANIREAFEGVLEALQDRGVADPEDRTARDVIEEITL